MINDEYSQGITNLLSRLLKEADVAGNPSSFKSRGISLTAQGPEEYVGNILEHPDLLWTDDLWDKSRVEDAKRRIELQGASVTIFWKKKYEDRANIYWNSFYKRNKTNFYKDRHYLHVVFPELAPGFHSNGKLKLLEVGCGVGNAILPLVEANPSLHVCAIDFADSAIKMLKQHPMVLSTGRIDAHVCCAVNDEIPLPPESTDIVLCMFVLSAMAPEAHAVVIRKLARVLKPGGKLLIRDYGRYDEAQLRFGKGSKLDENFYVRQDGTCAFYFDIDELRELCERGVAVSVPGAQRAEHEPLSESTANLVEAETKAAGSSLLTGLIQEEAFYIRRQYANRQQKVARYRVWIQAKFVKIS